MFYSVIIPCYNVADYVGETINSVLSQDFDDFEIVAVDDGSTDGKTPEILDDYAKKDGRIRVVHKENGGAPSARNVGLDAAQGDYILFLDSDDLLIDSYLGLAHEKIQTGTHTHTERERERERERD